MSIHSRIRRKIDLYGEDYTVNGKQSKGIFQLLESGKMRTYFDDTEVTIALRPAYFMVTYPDASIALGNSLTHDGTQLIVRKLLTEAFKGKDIARIVILTVP